jgi:hypothetical protein
MNGPLVPPPGCDTYAVLERGEETVVTIMAALPAAAAASEVGVDDDPASAVDERGFVQDTAHLSAQPAIAFLVRETSAKDAA